MLELEKLVDNEPWSKRATSKREFFENSILTRHDSPTVFQTRLLTPLANFDIKIVLSRFRRGRYSSVLGCVNPRDDGMINVPFGW